jgi:hypothetical protein
MRRIAQSTAYTFMLKVYLSTDSKTAATGKTVAIQISKAGGAFANPSAGATTATEVSNGWYKYTGSTTDIGTLGDLVIRGTATGCDDSEQVAQVVDAATNGATNLDAAVSTRMTATAGTSLATDVTAVKTVTTKLDTTIELDGASYRFNANALELTWDEALAGHTTAGTTGKVLSDINTNAATILTDTTNIKTRLPAALVGGRMDSLVWGVGAGAIAANSFAANSITASALATDAVAEIADGVWDEALSGHATAGSAGAALSSAGSGVTAPTAIENADALLDRANAVETGLTPRGLMRLVASGAAGKASGFGTPTVVYRAAVSDSKPRITATVDSTGNRSTVTTDTT